MRGGLAYSSEVPLSLYTLPEEIGYLEAQVWESRSFAQTLNKTGRGYSDGSGGPSHVPKMVSQGVATFEFDTKGPGDFNISDVHFLGGQVPGKQSVPRAELWGDIQTLSAELTQTSISTWE